MSPRVAKTSTSRSKSASPQRTFSLRRSGSANKKPTPKSESYSSRTTTRAASPSKVRTIFRLVLTWLGVFIVTLVLVDYAVQYLNYKASVAIVNGERLYRKDFYTKLEETYGSSIVSQMIDEALVYQEADKKEINITDKEIDAEINTLEEQYGGAEELQNELDLRNISIEKLRKQIETTLIVEKILSKDITITEDEIKAFYDQYKDVLFTETEVPEYEDAKETVKETLRDQKISEGVQSWLQELRDESSIKNNVENPKDYEILLITRTFFEDLFQGEEK